ncbi:MAG: hypothetical protein QXR80_01785 [Desulfurococcaceae archaeon]
MEESRLYDVIRKLAEEMCQDYNVSKRSSIVKLREELYNKYYVVEPLREVKQEHPVVFVDAGFQVFETDVAILIPVNIGARIRDEDGNLRRVSEISDFPPIETYFIYGRIIEEESKPEFKFRIFPVDESPLLLPQPLAEEISNSITGIVNTRLNIQLEDKSRTSLKIREDHARRFKRLAKYIEGLLEIAYAMRAGDLIARRSIKVVDGTLVRWFGLKQLRMFKFEGLDILSAILKVDKEKIARKIGEIYGLVKTTKFTSIARARTIFRKYGFSDAGLYANVTEESVKAVAEELNKMLLEGVIDKTTAEDVLTSLIRTAHPYTGIQVARFPVTADNVNIMYLEVHHDKPVLNIANNEVHFDSTSARELHSKVEEAVNNILAYRSTIEGSPPHGFMEVDRDVRLGGNMARKIEYMIVNSIREVTRELGHPLELVFSSSWRMRIGYR